MNEAIYQFLRGLLNTTEGKEIVLQAIEDHLDPIQLNVGFKKKSAQKVDIDFGKSNIA